MNSRLLLPIMIVSACIGAAIGISGYIWIVGGDGEASTELTAPTLDINAQPTTDPEILMTQLAEANAQLASLQATIAAQTQETAIEVASSEEVATNEEEPPSEEASTSERIQYRINQELSSVSFAVYEEVRGQPQDAVGTTNQVAGDIIIDFDNPQASQLGTIRINARSIATDSGFRDRALRAEILMSSRDEFEFIDFTPTSFANLPDQVIVGENYSVEITGDLTVRGTTNPVTFMAEITVISDQEISGTATTTITYTEWGIAIPTGMMIANVGDQATLTIEFVANQVAE